MKFSLLASQLSTGLGFIGLVSLSTACQRPLTPTAADPAAESSSTPALLTAQTTSPVTAARSAVREDSILPPVNPLEVRGDLVIAGSNSLAPLVEVMAERFIVEGFSGDLVIERVGSGAGFDIFCQDQKSDIAMASQAMSSEQASACRAAGREPVALAVGTDALAIVVGENNDFLKDVTQAELAKIFTAEYWSDVRANWPEELIRRTIPELGSGALNLFVEEIFDGDAKPLLQTPNTDFFSEDEDYLVQALAVDPFAIAFFSYSYYQSNRDTLKLISIDGDSPVNREAYFLIRPLYLYIDANEIAQEPQVAAFLTYFMTFINQEVSPLGYSPLKRKQLDKTKLQLLSTISQSIEQE